MATALVTAVLTTTAALMRVAKCDSKRNCGGGHGDGSAGRKDGDGSRNFG